MKKLRVLLVDDEIMIREGFKRLFDWARTTARSSVRRRTGWKPCPESTRSAPTSS